MKLFRKKLKQKEKVLAEARVLAAQRLEQYNADRPASPPMEIVKKSVSISRLRWR